MSEQSAELSKEKKKEKRIKRYSTLLCSVKEQGLETRKRRKLLAKEEEER